MYLMLIKKKYNITSNFSYLIFLVNGRMRPIRKLGVMFFSKIFRRFVLNIDVFYLYVLFHSGVNITDFFFFVIHRHVNAINII